MKLLLERASEELVKSVLVVNAVVEDVVYSLADGHVYVVLFGETVNSLGCVISFSEEIIIFSLSLYPKTSKEQDYSCDV